MKKRIISALLCAVVLIPSLFGCDKKTQTESENETVNNADETETEKSAEEQIKIIADNADMWFGIDVNTRYSYCVTDLDANGRLEVISSGIGGSGYFSMGNICEVNSSFDGLVKCTEDSIFELDMTLDDEIFCHIDPETGKAYYEVYDYARAGVGMYTIFNYALAFENEKYELTYISSYDMYPDSEGNETVTIKYHDDTALTYEEYEVAYDTYFEGFDKKTVTFGWQEAEELQDFIKREDGIYIHHKLPEREEFIARLTDSYNKFSIK